jgi:hypothetical protein
MVNKAVIVHISWVIIYAYKFVHPDCITYKQVGFTCLEGKLALADIQKLSAFQKNLRGVSVLYYFTA